MPIKSRKQLAKFGALVKEGKMKQEVMDNWIKETPEIHALPERAIGRPVRPWKRPRSTPR